MPLSGASASDGDKSGIRSQVAVLTRVEHGCRRPGADIRGMWYRKARRINDIIVRDAKGRYS